MISAAEQAHWNLACPCEPGDDSFAPSVLTVPRSKTLYSMAQCQSS